MTRLASYQVCDEVLPVGSGKLCYIGLYGPELVVTQVPFELTQLYFIVTLRTDIDDRPTKFRVRIEQPGTATPFIYDAADALPKVVEGHRATEDARFFLISTTVRLAPFVVHRLGTLRVFVEDERGDNYAGGLRLRQGVHQDLLIPQLAQSAQFAAAHLERVKQAAPKFAEQAAYQMLNDVRLFMTFLGSAPTLPSPEGELRIPIGRNRVHVLFPKPIVPPPIVHIGELPTGTQANIVRVDELGFVVEFSPTAPPDPLFAFSLEEAAANSASGTGRRRGH